MWNKYRVYTVYLLKYANHIIQNIVKIQIYHKMKLNEIKIKIKITIKFYFLSRFCSFII